ncbi:MAG TPA: class I SAM-dependent methyltransferase [Candidatus Dojkabacteria bacterium]|nr:class I SAM-dependent methyltransferase [Candidatus Dojkabacteria bacterium]
MDIALENCQSFESPLGHNYLDKKSHRVRNNIACKFIEKSINSNSSNKIKILDIGCGDGRLLEKLISKRIEVYGIDISPTSVRKAKEKGVKAIVANLEEALPYESKMFDIIYSGETLEHLFNTNLHMLEINRILKPGGKLVLTTPNLNGFDDRIKFLLGFPVRHINPLCEIHRFHIRPFNFRMLKQLMTSSGLKVLDLKSNRIRFASFKKNRLESYFLAKLFPHLGSSLIIHAEKVDDVKEINMHNCVA